VPITSNDSKLHFMPKVPQRPTALTIAGSDSGGGAGIQADLKTFAALGVHGASAIACLTAQNPRHVLAVESCPPGMLRRQIEAVFEELHPAAVKTGMLLTAENILVAAKFFGVRAARLRVPLVVDPVMVSTSGAILLQPKAIAVLKQQLLPKATLVTPNLAEAGILTERKITSIEDMRTAAREIHTRFGCAALIKGGHLRGGGEAVDIFFDGRTELLLSAPFIKGIRTHGTGCTCSAAVTGYLARGANLPEAVKHAKQLVTDAIAGSYRVGKHFALNQLLP
jgi:hydroxymethylpyrimidine/phosphomethylpyrimidine kinase